MVHTGYILEKGNQSNDVYFIYSVIYIDEVEYISDYDEKNRKKKLKIMKQE